MSEHSPKSSGGSERAQPESLRAKSLQPSLTVKDVQKSLEWYRDVVGFTVDEQHEREGKVVAVSLKAGTVRLLLGQDNGAKGWDRLKGEGFSLMLITSQDIDGIAARIKAAGSTLASEPTDMPWGQRVFRVRDPDGFLLVIASERA